MNRKTCAHFLRNLKIRRLKCVVNVDSMKLMHENHVTMLPYFFLLVTKVFIINPITVS